MTTKNDMERLGVFKELGYTTVGDPYTPPNKKPFNANASKGKQMTIGGTKTKSALQSGYFNDKFNRYLLRANGYICDAISLQGHGR